MRILLVGNYEFSYQQSMQRFARLLERGFYDAGHEVHFIRPEPIFGRLRASEHGLGKWLGYIDRFVIFPFYLRRAIKNSDVVHICDHGNAMYVAHLKGVPHVVTCHDVMAIRVAAGEIGRSRSGISGRFFQTWILKSLKRANLVVCVSEQTAKELVAVSGMADALLRVVPNSLNYQYSPMLPEVAGPFLLELGLSQGQPYFLHVGGNQWYKNRLGVLGIFYELARRPEFSGHRLVMAGKEWTDEMRSSVLASGFAEQISELTNLDNEQLRALYSMADAMIFPSLHEGFGWPIIEAQACGTIVATTNAAPMCDVAGKDAAILIDPSDESAAAAAIAATLAEDTMDLRCRGLKNSSQYSVEAMINGYLDAYSHALSS